MSRAALILILPEQFYSDGIFRSASGCTRGPAVSRSRIAPYRSLKCCFALVLCRGGCGRRRPLLRALILLFEGVWGTPTGSVPLCHFVTFPPHCGGIFPQHTRDPRGSRLSLHANRVEALRSRVTFLSPQATYITPQRKRIRLDCENRHSARLGGTGSGTASRRGVEGARSPLMGPRGKAPSRERGYF